MLDLNQDMILVSLKFIEKNSLSILALLILFFIITLSSLYVRFIFSSSLKELFKEFLDSTNKIAQILILIIGVSYGATAIHAYDYENISKKVETLNIRSKNIEGRIVELYVEEFISMACVEIKLYVIEKLKIIKMKNGKVPITSWRNLYEICLKSAQVNIPPLRDIAVEAIIETKNKNTHIPQDVANKICSFLIDEIYKNVDYSNDSYREFVCSILKITGKYFSPQNSKILCFDTDNIDNIIKDFKDVYLKSELIKKIDNIYTVMYNAKNKINKNIKEDNLLSIY